MKSVFILISMTMVVIISFNLFSFRGSVQDYKIHMDMEIVILVCIMVFDFVSTLKIISILVLKYILLPI